MNLSGNHERSSFSPDGRLLAFADDHAAITVCDLTTGHLRELNDPSRRKVEPFEFSYDNRYLFASVAPTHQIWDLAKLVRFGLCP